MKFRCNPVYLFLIMILLAITITPIQTHAVFGDDDSFGQTFEVEFYQDGGSWDIDRADSPYFIHDTLKKLILLLVFLIMGIITMMNKRSLRKPLLIISIIILGFYLKGFLCPLSSVQNVILKYDTGYLLLFLVPTILGIALGRVFCGYTCVFGAAQELFHISKYSVKLPECVVNMVQKLKYVVLLYLVIRILVSNSLIFAGYTPFNALFSWGGAHVSIILSILTAVMSTIIYRPFCQFFCPLGAWLGVCSMVSKFSILPKDCVQCDRCKSACSFNAIRKGTIDKKECILCGMCVDSCRVSLSKNNKRSSRKISTAATLGAEHL